MRLDSFDHNPNDWFKFDWEHVVVNQVGLFFYILPHELVRYDTDITWTYSEGLF
jgi:hypothetical protein